MYWENELRCRKYTLRISYFLIFHTFAFTVTLVYAAYCILMGKYDTSSWYLSFNVVLPFDKTKLFGWFLTWAAQFSMALAYALPMVSLTSYFISCCFYIHTMCKHVTNIMDSVQRDVEDNLVEISPSKILKKRQKILNQLIEVVKLHVEILGYVFLCREILVHFPIKFHWLVFQGV